MRHPWIALVALLCPTPASAHPLADAAAEMEPGDWLELETANLVPTLDSVNGNVLEYADSGAWDPVSEQFFYAGQGHSGGTGVFKVVRFDAEANGWDALPEPAWYAGYPHQITHGYDHSVVDPDAGVFYFRPFEWDVIYSYEIETGQWGELPPVPDWGQWANCCGGLAHFPEMGALVLVATGSLVVYDLQSGSWDELANDISMGSYHNFAEYSPGEGAVIFGGGNADQDEGPLSRALYRLDADGNYTQLGDAPLALGTLGSVVAVDPVSGTYLAVGEGGVLHAYELATDSWGIASEEAPIPVFNTIAAPIPNYGVVLYVSHYEGQDSRVHLFKNSPFVPDPDPETTGGSDSGDGSAGDGDSGGEGDSADQGGSSGGDGGSGGSGSATDDAAEGCGCRQASSGFPLVLLAFVVVPLVRRS